MDQQQPGVTITPQNQPSSAPVPPVAPKDAAPEAPTDQPASQWQFRADDEDGQPEAQSPDKRPASAQSVSWTSSEFIAHEKSAGWYGMLGLGAVIVAAIVFLLTHDKISTSVVIVAAVVLGVFAARKPRVLGYKVDASGIGIGTKFYDYDNFKSFSMVQEGATSAITLMPLKRFMPQLTLYYESKDEDQIVDILADRLPMEHRPADMVDRFMHRIRF